MFCREDHDATCTYHSGELYQINKNDYNSTNPIRKIENYFIKMSNMKTTNQYRQMQTIYSPNIAVIIATYLCPKHLKYIKDRKHNDYGDSEMTMIDRNIVVNGTLYTVYNKNKIMHATISTMCQR